MALAALYANLDLSKDSALLPKAHAFIVDHKVRPESTEEAEWVAEQCRSKCIQMPLHFGSVGLTDGI